MEKLIFQIFQTVKKIRPSNNTSPKRGRGGGLGCVDPRSELFADQSVDKNSSMGKTYWVLYGDSLFMELLILFIYFLFIPNKILKIPGPPSLFPDPKNKYVRMTPPPP